MAINVRKRGAARGGDAGEPPDGLHGGAAGVRANGGRAGTEEGDEVGAGSTYGRAVAKAGCLTLPMSLAHGVFEGTNGKGVGLGEEAAGGELGGGAGVGLRRETLGADASGAYCEAVARTGEKTACADECASWGECYYCHRFGV